MKRKFDEQKLIAQLVRLPVPLRIAFAASCAERQMRSYRLFKAQWLRAAPDAMQGALDDIWNRPYEVDDAGAFEEYVEGLMALIPQEASMQNSWSQEATNAQNAGMAVVYALRTMLRGEPQEAAWAARVAYEALDNFVINNEGIDPSTPGGQARVLMHPLIQAELRRQERDIQELLATSGQEITDAIMSLRARAKAEAADFFGLIS